jgi:hypothetical protein
MEERRLGPVVGLGTYDTFGGDRRLATEVVSAALPRRRLVADVRRGRGLARRGVARAT